MTRSLFGIIAVVLVAVVCCVAPALALTAPPVPDDETARWWREHVSVAGLAPDLDAVFRCAARRLPAAISRIRCS